MFPITFNAFGDILAFAQLAYGIAKALNDARGAAADYKRLVHDLNAMGAVVIEAHRIASASKDTHIKAAILDEVCLCNAAVAEVGKLLPGFASLSSSAAVESRRARVQHALKKIQWHLMKSSDAAALANRFHTSHQRLDLYIVCLIDLLVDDGFRRLSGELSDLSDASGNRHRFTQEKIAQSTARISEKLHEQSERTTRGHSQLQQSIDDAKETIGASIRLLLAQSSRESCDLRREIATMVSKHFATSPRRDVALAERTSNALMSRLRTQLSALDLERQRFMSLLVPIAIFGAAFVARNDIDPRWRATTLWATICAALVIFARLQTTLPPSMSENTITLIDALGERIPLALQICDSLEHFHSFLDNFYTTRNRKGHTFVRQKLYEIYSAGSSQAITSTSWAFYIKQGATIEMGILLLRRVMGQLPSILQCPRCGADAIRESRSEYDDYCCMGCANHFQAIAREIKAESSATLAAEDSSSTSSGDGNYNDSTGRRLQSTVDPDLVPAPDAVPTPDGLQSAPVVSNRHKDSPRSRESESLHEFKRLILVTEWLNLRSRGRERKNLGSFHDGRRSPTPSGCVPLSQRKPVASGWDVHAPGYEHYSATQAKQTGLFNLPGANLIGMRQSRCLYIDSITPYINEQNLADFFNEKLAGTTSSFDGPGNPVLAVQCNYEKNYASVEFRSAEDATAAMAFDGIIFINGPLKIRRPKDYGGMEMGAPYHVAGAVSTNVPDSEHKIFIGGLPANINEEQVMDFLKSFGELKAFNLVREPSTGASKGFAFVEYADPEVTDVVIEVLPGMEIGNRTLVAQLASVGAKQGTLPEMPQLGEIPRSLQVGHAE